MTNSLRDNEFIARNIPEYYQEVYKKLREKKFNLKITGSLLRDTLQKMLTDDPALMVEVLRDTTIQAAIDANTKEEKLNLERLKRDLNEKERSLTRFAKTLNDRRDDIEQMFDDAQKKMDTAKAEEMELQDAIGNMETAEMRDRYRAYMAYKLQFQDKLRSPQNNSMFIAGAAAVLVGGPIALNKEVKPDD